MRLLYTHSRGRIFISFLLLFIFCFGWNRLMNYLLWVWDFSSSGNLSGCGRYTYGFYGGDSYDNGISGYGEGDSYGNGLADGSGLGSFIGRYDDHARLG
jgi:hypothetical protein